MIIRVLERERKRESTCKREKERERERKILLGANLRCTHITYNIISNL